MDIPALASAMPPLILRYASVLPPLFVRPRTEHRAKENGNYMGITWEPHGRKKRKENAPRH